VDSPRPSGGPLAKKHGFTLGHIAEVIVWHELGHNYISKFLPTEQVIALYENHHLLYGHLQELYADLTSLHHSSPPARKVAMMFRLSELSHYDPAESHTRAAHAIGAIFLAKVLAHPERWPSVHLPPKVPRRNVELNLIRYVYETLDADWTFTEDEAWRGYVNSWIRSYGRRPLSRSTKGMIHMPNKLKMNIMAADDRAHQAERDRWLAERLRAAISSGRADAKFPRLGARIEIPGVFEPPFRGSYRDYDIRPGDIEEANPAAPDDDFRTLDPDELRRLLQPGAPGSRRPGRGKQPNRARPVAPTGG
ncbi:MAG: hypothetical protein OER86_07590, partial [Phycisphaerae bacterium]|nr:hypothetical protein [Phycisphaerae bacterium]